jgi:AraC-like DNA-binding protein
VSTLEKALKFEDIAGIEKYTTRFSRLADDYIFWHLEAGDEPIKTLAYPLRISGLTVILCRRGTLDVEINLHQYHVTENTLIVVNPDALIRCTNIDYTDIDAYTLFVSTGFLLDVNIDLNAVNVRSLVEKRSPFFALTLDDTNMFSRYLELLDKNAAHDSETIFSRNIARSLIQAVIYQLFQFSFNRINAKRTDNPALNRRTTYVRDFMRLVHLNYVRERSVTFYADKLFISPKYLSLLVKNATGRSALDWINQFVTIEAKNLLKFSGKNVQQVAYALNFPNQSSFGKYFKHQTGLSPLAYQKNC